MKNKIYVINLNPSKQQSYTYANKKQTSNQMYILNVFIFPAADFFNFCQADINNKCDSNHGNNKNKIVI